MKKDNQSKKSDKNSIREAWEAYRKWLKDQMLADLLDGLGIPPHYKYV